jgi:hypothetical protein
VFSRPSERACRSSALPGQARPYERVYQRYGVPTVVRPEREGVRIALMSEKLACRPARDVGTLEHAPGDFGS